MTLAVFFCFEFLATWSLLLGRSSIFARFRGSEPLATLSKRPFEIGNSRLRAFELGMATVW
jgi:hypothetical protein